MTLVLGAAAALVCAAAAWHARPRDPELATTYLTIGLACLIAGLLTR